MLQRFAGSQAMPSGPEPVFRRLISLSSLRSMTATALPPVRATKARFASGGMRMPLAPPSPDACLHGSCAGVENDQTAAATAKLGDQRQLYHLA